MRLKEKYQLHKKAKSLLSVLLAVILSVPLFILPAPEAQAADQVLTLRACRALAIQNSSDYESCEDAVISKQAAYESAVKALKVKEQSMKQFRWSPLLNFKFPTSPDFGQASEFQYKPVSLQYDIMVAQHKMQDKAYEITEKVNTIYVEIVVLQRNIAFNERRAEAYDTGLKKNQARVRTGEAKQADVDKLEKKLETVNDKIASDRRTLEADLQKLSKMLEMDVTTGYTFETPFIETTIDRTMLPALITYTEDRDETYYEACIAATTAKAELNTNSGLMKKKYGGDYNMIAGYVSGALNGNQINKKAFKADYKSFLSKIDSYWNGKKRILFIKIPRLWFKGDMDGTRYIEDDPYALYQNVLDYASAAKDEKAAKEDLDQSVTDAFNNYISVRNSYANADRELKKAEEQLKKDEMKNRLGQLSFEEYDSELESYEELQNGLLDAMKLYTTTLYSFDRLTCGGISAILSGTDADMQTAVVGESYIEENTADGAYYTMKSIIQKQEFELSIFVPDDFPTDITDFELWVDNVMVGDRTAKDKKLRHLQLVTESVTEVKLRLYNGDEFVDDCVIDPSEESGPLKITTGFDIKKDDPEEIGTFELNISEVTGLVELKIKPEDDKVRKYKVLTEQGKAVGSEDMMDINKPLKHLTLLRDSLPDLSIELYDESGALLCTGRFDVQNGILRREEAE